MYTKKLNFIVYWLRVCQHFRLVEVASFRSTTNSDCIQYLNLVHIASSFFKYILVLLNLG